MLSERGIVDYLMERGLLVPGQLFDGQLSVSDASRRHLTATVISDRGPSYVVKQGLDEERGHALAREAHYCTRLTGSPAYRELRPFVPACRHYDEANEVLVLELVEAAESLRDHHARHGRTSRLLAGQMGRILALLHRHPIPQSEGTAPASTSHSRMPWILFVSRPTLSQLADSSPASVECVKLLQYFSSPALLAPLEEQWSPDCLIHGDARFDNWLAVSAAGADGARKTRLRLIDWELAGPGDPRWDVGCVLSDYLSTWVLSIPVALETDAAALPSLANLPLERIQPAIRSFWGAYSEFASLDPARAHRFLLTAVGFGAARMIQTAYEITQTQTQIPSAVVRLIQLALNVLSRPHEAVVHLLGIRALQADGPARA